MKLSTRSRYGLRAVVDLAVYYGENPVTLSTLANMQGVSEAYADKAFVCKVNVDECQDIAVRFGVSSIPTVLVFKNGELVDRAVGARPKKAFEQMLDQQLQD